MVIIATHNGLNFLVGLLDDIKRYGVPNEKVVIVDNHSTREDHHRYLEKLKEKGYNVMTNGAPTYEIGAYRWALDNGMKDDVYFFFQDSIRLTENIFETIPPKLTDDNVYTFLTFPCGVHDHDPNDKRCLMEHYGTTEYSKGLFGNMMFARHSVIERVKDDWVIPTDKLGSTTGERGLGVVFDRHNIEIKGMMEYDTNRRLDSGYPFFKKIHGFNWR